MGKPTYRYYRGEKTNPYDEEKDLSRYNFWRMEAAFDWMADFDKRPDGLCLDAAHFYRKGYVPDFIEEWDAPDSEKGLLMWMILQCSRWCPYDAPEVDWELYTKQPPSR